VLTGKIIWTYSLNSIQHETVWLIGFQQDRTNFDNVLKTTCVPQNTLCPIFDQDLINFARLLGTED
jgi:hypothetical protein